MKEALDSVQSGKSWGLISFPENYTVHLRSRFTFRNFVDNETSTGSQITIKLDRSCKLYHHNTLLNSSFCYNANSLFDVVLVIEYNSIWISNVS